MDRTIDVVKNVGSPAEELVQILEKLEAPNVSRDERFELEITLAKLMYGFGFKQGALRQLKSTAHHIDGPIAALVKLIQTLDPTWTAPTNQHQANVKQTLAESEFDITVLDD